MSGTAYMNGGVRMQEGNSYWGQESGYGQFGGYEYGQCYPGYYHQVKREPDFVQAEENPSLLEKALLQPQQRYQDFYRVEDSQEPSSSSPKPGHHLKQDGMYPGFTGSFPPSLHDAGPPILPTYQPDLFEPPTFLDQIPGIQGKAYPENNNNGSPAKTPQKTKEPEPAIQTSGSIYPWMKASFTNGRSFDYLYLLTDI
jgi:hypothetical protein